MIENSPSPSLLERARVGDPAALAELFGRHGRAVYRVAFRLTDSSQEAEDVVQDIFVGLPETLKTYDGSGSFEGWLKALAARHALIALRRERLRRRIRIERKRALPRYQGSERMVDGLALERALSALPGPLRSVFVLKEIEGYTHEEIGEMLGIGKSGSANKLMRARRMLRDLLGGGK